MSKKRNQPTQTDPLDRYRGLLSEGEFRRMVDALAQPLPQAIRLNPLKVDPGRAIEEWSERYGWRVQAVPFCPTGWQVLEARTPPSGTVEFRMGEYYIQDAASMLPAELLDFHDIDAPLVLDLAAAPGGKTTHLVSRGEDRGLVVGNDSSPGRISALRGVLRDWGAINAAVTNFPGERFGAWFPETFDRALLDAPCSMENLRPSGSHPRRYTSERERDELAQRQLRLLASAIQAVRVGGQVLYSTCTLAPEEDESVLDRLLKLYPTSVEIQELGSSLPHPAPGLTADETQSFNPAVRRAARLWPHSFGTSGFFAALIQKTATVEAPYQEPPTRPLEKVGWQRLSQKDKFGLIQFFQEEYKFDLDDLLSRQDLCLWQRGEGVHVFPETYMRGLHGLPVEGLGLLVGEDTAQGFAISHEWAARFGKKFQQGTLLLPEEQVAGWVRGEDIQGSIPGLRTGQVVVVKDAAERNLGRGRAQGQRLKNLLPRRLV